MKELIPDGLPIPAPGADADSFLVVVAIWRSAADPRGAVSVTRSTVVRGGGMDVEALKLRNAVNIMALHATVEIRDRGWKVAPPPDNSDPGDEHHETYPA